jgi:hypothetical protein
MRDTVGSLGQYMHQGCAASAAVCHSFLFFLNKILYFII